MEHFDRVEWNTIWNIIKDIVLPHTGTLIFNIIIFLFLGLIISIIYIIILYKKKVLKRKPKYYNWTVKLYIPMLLIGILFLFGQIGFIRGVYKILDKENETIVSSLYNNMLELSFESEQSKNEFIIGLQQAARDAKDNSNALKEYIETTTTEYNTGYSVIDTSKNKLSSFLISKYGDDIYKISVYGMLSAAGAKAHVDMNESLSYEDFSVGMDFLLEVGHKDIEQAVKEKLMVWFNTLLYNQYKSLVFFQLVLFFFIISLPVIEFFIYKKWIEPKYSYQKKIASEENIN